MRFFARLVTLLCVFAFLEGFATIGEAHANPSDCVSSGGDVDVWVSRGLSLAGLPDNPPRHAALKKQAWVESGYEPNVVNLWDLNAALGHPSVGLEQIVPAAWASTPTGTIYPFGACASDPAVSVAVRAELFEMGHYG